MKILVCSDLHGDINYTKALISYFKKEKFDRLYLLGDLLEDSILLLNELSDKITAVEGNCDSYTEIEDAKFMMRDINYDYAFDKFIVLSHGHLYSPFNYTSGYDIFIYGHTHIHQLYQGKDGKIILNPGSLSCPRDGIHSVATIDSEGIKIIDFNTEYVIEKLKF